MSGEGAVSQPGSLLANPLSCANRPPPQCAQFRITRRAVLAGSMAAIARPALAIDPAAQPIAFPGAPTILVAGPPGGRVDHWATLIAEPLGKSLMQAQAVGRENVGGPDGVTGANQFQALTTADGGTAMLMPGTAAMSWLVGDPRVRFDVGRWAPLWGGTVSALAASSKPLVPGKQLRVAVPNLIGPELAALLALELIGIPAIAVPVDPATPLTERNDIDLILLRGASLKQDAAALPAQHWTVQFTLGVIREDGSVARDPAFANIPTLYELVDHSNIERPAELVAALRAVGAAAGLDVGLVLPLLSPASAVAWWRRGCTTLTSAPNVQAEAARTLVRPMEAGPMAASVARITTETSVLLALRRWLADRHQWRPG